MSNANMPNNLVSVKRLPNDEDMYRFVHPQNPKIVMYARTYNTEDDYLNSLRIIGLLYVKGNFVERKRLHQAVADILYLAWRDGAEPQPLELPL